MHNQKQPFQVGDLVVLKYEPGGPEWGDRDAVRRVTAVRRAGTYTTGWIITLDELPSCPACDAPTGCALSLDAGWLRYAAHVVHASVAPPAVHVAARVPSNARVKRATAPLANEPLAVAGEDPEHADIIPHFEEKMSWHVREYDDN